MMSTEVSPLRVVTQKAFSLGAPVLAGSVAFLISARPHAHDRWDPDHCPWRHERHETHERYIEHHRYIAERPVYVRERPVIVERPVMMAPMYQAPAPSGLNLNFNIPLQ